MTISPVLRINMSGCGRGPDRALEADRYQAAIAMAEYAEKTGFAIVNVEEHQDTEIGWLSSPGEIMLRTAQALGLVRAVARRDGAGRPFQSTE